MTLNLTLSLEEFLARPEVKPYEEYLEGRAVPKSTPTFPHSLTQAEMAKRLGNWADEHDGYVVSEQRCILRPGTDSLVLLPDVAYFPPDAFATLPTGAVDVPATLAVEILSPDDSYGRVQSRVSTFLNGGVKLVWIVDPVARNVTVHRPGQPAELVTDRLQDPLLPGFSLPLATLFRRLP